MKTLNTLALLALVLCMDCAFSQPITVYASPWSTTQPAPQVGFNSRVVNIIDSDGCTIPDTLTVKNDWRTAEFRQAVAGLQPQILRFPGGTNANYWFWEDETRTVLNDAGGLVDLQICEGTFIDVPNSIQIGCEEPWVNMTAETFEAIKTKTTTTFSDFFDAVSGYQDAGVPVQEMYLLSMIDPFYYLNSPQFEYEFGNLSIAEKRQKLGEISYQRAMKQVRLILKAYCGNCQSYDGELLFELANEAFLQRYGKYFPFEACYTTPNPCEECFPDVDMYIAVCQALIPAIRARFPNSKISVSGGRRRIAGKFWNRRLLDEFGPGAPMETEGITIHSYPRASFESRLNQATCLGELSELSAQDLMAEHQYLINNTLFRRGMEVISNSGWDVWLTEFNVNNNSEICEEITGTSFIGNNSVFYLTNWTHLLGVLTQLHAMISISNEVKAPWLDLPYYNPMSKLCMHNLLGSRQNAAIFNDLSYPATGMAAQIFQELNASADNLQFIGLFNQPHGNQPSAEQLNTLQHYSIQLEPDPANELPNGYTAPGAWGMSFTNATGRKVLFVNLSENPLQVNLTALGTAPGNATARVISVPPDSLFISIKNGFETSFLRTDTLALEQGQLLLPPFGIAVISGEANIETCPEITAQSSLPTSCGSQACAPCNCEFTLLQKTNFEQGMGVWSSSGGGAAYLLQLPQAIQGEASFLGQKLLAMPSAPSPFVNITTPTVNTNSATRIQINFLYSAMGMNGPADRLVLSYSNDGGQSFIQLTTWQHGVHFENGGLNKAVFVSEAPIGPQTQLRLRARAEGSGKIFYIDNVELSFCPVGAATNAPKFELHKAVNQMQVALYPNPTAGSVHIDLEGLNQDVPVELSAYDVLGRRMAQKSYTSARTALKFMLETAQWPSGMYIVEIVQGDKRHALKLQKL